MQTSKKVLIGAVVFLGLVLGAVLTIDVKRTRQAAREPRILQLTDGTVAHFRGDTTVTPAATYPNPKDIRVDGDAYIQVPAGSAPWTVRTRLLVLTVRGDTVFRVTAYSKQPGEQVEVVRGRMEARKSYPSPYAIPDDLGPGEMVMINRDIDLMEKERTNAEEVRRWGEALMLELRSRSR